MCQIVYFQVMKEKYPHEQFCTYLSGLSCHYISGLIFCCLLSHKLNYDCIHCSCFLIGWTKRYEEKERSYQTSHTRYLQHQHTSVHNINTHWKGSNTHIAHLGTMAWGVPQGCHRRAASLAWHRGWWGTRSCDCWQRWRSIPRRWRSPRPPPGSWWNIWRKPVWMWLHQCFQHWRAVCSLLWSWGPGALSGLAECLLVLPLLLATCHQTTSSLV